jgi:hypothetical protein
MYLGGELQLTVDVETGTEHRSEDFKCRGTAVACWQEKVELTNLAAPQFARTSFSTSAP